jgi:ATP-dependent DNA ligase
VEPRLVGEVSYSMWTQDDRLRNPSWRGLRHDIKPEDVRWADRDG